MFVCICAFFFYFLNKLKKQKQKKKKIQVCCTYKVEILQMFPCRSPACFSTFTPPQSCHSACATPPSDPKCVGPKQMQICSQMYFLWGGGGDGWIILNMSWLISAIWTKHLTTVYTTEDNGYITNLHVYIHISKYCNSSICNSFTQNCCLCKKTKTKPKTFLRIYLPTPPNLFSIITKAKLELEWQINCVHQLALRAIRGLLVRRWITQETLTKKNTEQRIWVVKTTDIRPKARAVCLSYERRVSHAQARYQRCSFFFFHVAIKIYDKQKKYPLLLYKSQTPSGSHSRLFCCFFSPSSRFSFPKIPFYLLSSRVYFMLAPLWDSLLLVRAPWPAALITSRFASIVSCVFGHSVTKQSIGN